MNILANSSISYMSQVSSMSSFNKQNVQSTFSSNQNQTDEVSFSSEGKAMSKMLRTQESLDSQEAHKVAFEEAYSELNMENLDTENMTDDEMKDALESFETLMQGHMNENFKPSSEMNSTELKNTISNIKDMATKMNDSSGEYGSEAVGGKGRPPKAGGPPPSGGPGKSGGVEETSSSDDIITTLLEALEDDEDEEEDDLASQLLETLETSGQETYTTSNYRSMQEMLAQLSPAV